MEKNIAYTEDDLVQLYQEGVITLQDFIEMHPEGWLDEYVDYCDSLHRDPDEGSALDFLALKDAELERAMEEGEA